MAGRLSPQISSILQLTSLILVSITRESLSLQFNVFSSGNVYRFSLLETSPELTQIGAVACTEAGGGGLTAEAEYFIIDSSSLSLPFQLDQQMGELTLANGSSLDFETSESYMFSVSCNYVSDPTTSVSATVEVSVLPVNEFLPALGNPSVSLNVSESTPVGSVLASTDTSGIVRYTVSDSDSGHDGELRFLPGPDNPTGITIDEITGAVILNQGLDLDNSDVPIIRLSLLIGVCDGDRARSECVNQELAVIVTPSNDNVPQFDQNEYEISVSESTPVGSSLIDIACSDDDRFVGVFRGISVVPANGPVHIPDMTNGTVILRQPLDYESESSLTVSLICRDSGSPVLEDNATLMVNILPENDNSPYFNQTSYKFTTNRIAILGEQIGLLAAVDLDRVGRVDNEVMYSLIGEGSENFAIRSDGVLVTNDFLFVAEGGFFALTVVASDGKFNASAQVHINVNGVLSIPEIIIICVSGVLLFVAVIVAIVICCCCCTGCCRRREFACAETELYNLRDKPFMASAPRLQDL